MILAALSSHVLLGFFIHCFLSVSTVVSFSFGPFWHNIFILPSRYPLYTDANLNTGANAIAIINGHEAKKSRRVALSLHVNNEISSYKAGVGTRTSREQEQEQEETNVRGDLQVPDPLPIINILYESDQILAIEKPPHFSHHDEKIHSGPHVRPEVEVESEPEATTATTTRTMGILSILRYMQQNNLLPSSYKGRLYGVHRLDKVTSGILLLAKNKEVAGMLSRSFQDRTVTKYYVALSHKKPKKKKQGWVRGDMTVSRRGAWKLVSNVKSGSGGTKQGENHAVTRFFTAGLGNCHFGSHAWRTHHDHDKEIGTSERQGNLLFPKTLILFRPHTGKTHQLRVAAKSLGLPILGDVLYGDANDAKKVERTYLHAVALHVNINGEKVTIYNPPTSWFEEENYEDDRGGDGNNNGLEDVLTKLVRKHCESEDILKLI